MSGTCLNQVSYYYACPRNQGLLGVIPVPHPLPQSVLSIQQVLRKGLRKSLLHLPHHITSFLSVVIVLFNISVFPLGPPPKYCDTGFSKREELPLINDSELKWGGVRRLCSHLSQKTGEPVPETMGTEQEQGVGQGLILEPSQQPGF